MKIWIRGEANVLADAFSMGFGDFISGRLESSFIEGERAKEVKEFHKVKKCSFLKTVGLGNL